MYESQEINKMFKHKWKMAIDTFLAYLNRVIRGFFLRSPQSQRVSKWKSATSFSYFLAKWERVMSS